MHEAVEHQQDTTPWEPGDADVLGAVLVKRVSRTLSSARVLYPYWLRRLECS